MMDHPNIAKVLDAGMTEGRLPSRPDDGDKDVAAPMSAGRPYFVMELVRGIKIGAVITSPHDPKLHLDGRPFRIHRGTGGAVVDA